MLFVFYLRGRYYDLLEVYDGQVLGLCKDGWPRDEDQITGQYGVTPSFDWDLSSVKPYAPHLLCEVPVKVYECPAGSSKDECARAPVANMTAFHRSRTYKTGVYCWQEKGVTMWKQAPCDAQAWNCSSQPCDAYEKARRICAASLREDGYPCYFYPPSEEAGLRDSPFEYPELAHDQFTNLSGFVVGYTGTFIFVCWLLRLRLIQLQQRAVYYLCCSCTHPGELCLFITFYVLMFVWLIATEVLIFVFLFPDWGPNSLWGALRFPESLEGLTVSQYSSMDGFPEKPVPGFFNAAPAWVKLVQFLIFVAEVYILCYVLRAHAMKLDDCRKFWYRKYQRISRRGMADEFRWLQVQDPESNSDA